MAALVKTAMTNKSNYAFFKYCISLFFITLTGSTIMLLSFIKWFNNLVSFYVCSQNCQKRLLTSSCPSVRMKQLDSH